MAASVLCPIHPRLRLVRATNSPRPPSLAVGGVSREAAKTTVAKVRAAAESCGLAVPHGRVDVCVSPSVEHEFSAGLDLAVAVAVLLADPRRRHLRQTGLVAWGELALDGGLRPVEQSMAGLPSTPWMGRFFEPTDRIPDVGEHAVLTVVDVDGLTQAWDVVAGLVEISKRLDEMRGPVR